MTISLEQQIACIGRELGMRRAAYPRMVAATKIDQSKADSEIAAMEAVYQTLKWLQTHRARILELAPDLRAERTAPAALEE